MGILLPPNWDNMKWSEQYKYFREHSEEYPQILDIISVDTCPGKEVNYSRNPFSMNFKAYKPKPKRKRRRP